MPIVACKFHVSSYHLPAMTDRLRLESVDFQEILTDTLSAPFLSDCELTVTIGCI